MSHDISPGLLITKQAALDSAISSRQCSPSFGQEACEQGGVDDATGRRRKGLRGFGDVDGDWLAIVLVMTLPYRGRQNDDGL